MKKNTIRSLCSLLALVFMFSLWVPATTANADTKTGLDKKKIVLVKGQEDTLFPYNAWSTVVQWNSSNPKVATITGRLSVGMNTGIVKAVKAGKTTITAKVGDKTYKCLVTVEAPSLSKKSLKLQVGASSKLKLKGTSQKLTWKSSNKKIAAVNSKGKVTAKKAGKAKITVTTKSGKSYTCKVTVTGK